MAWLRKLSRLCISKILLANEGHYPRSWKKELELVLFPEKRMPLLWFQHDPNQRFRLLPTWTLRILSQPTSISLPKTWVDKVWRNEGPQRVRHSHPFADRGFEESFRADWRKMIFCPNQTDPACRLRRGEWFQRFFLGPIPDEKQSKYAVYKKSYRWRYRGGWSI